jgi:transcriptional regulator with XRE-family HTH domain
MHESDKPRLNIRAVRESRGYTQEYMAEMLDICQSTYACLESGKTSLSIHRLIRIADILEVDLPELIDYKKVPKGQIGLRQPKEGMFNGNMHQETIGVYEKLIVELRSEIDFLRALIRPS